MEARWLQSFRPCLSDSSISISVVYYLLAPTLSIFITRSSSAPDPVLLDSDVRIASSSVSTLECPD